MKKGIAILLSIFAVSLVSAHELIRIGTDKTDLILRTDADNGRLYQVYLGAKLNEEYDLHNLLQVRGTEAYVTHGMEDLFEPAVRVLHADGNPSLLLKYAGHEQRGNLTKIELRDDAYPVYVTLFYVVFPAENVIKMWSEIRHGEKGSITLYNYASSMLHFGRSAYWLTQFSGDWAHEANRFEQQLAVGKKVLDTRLGSRANMFVSPYFLLGLDGKVREREGEVVVGTLGWTGNFRFTFEVDNERDLRVISGINPYGSEYRLAKGEIFRTPEFIFTYSAEGVGPASRDFHTWALKHRLKDGDGDRMTLLNNWESTGFGFDQKKLEDIMADAAQLGVDMFLLDDGWFGNGDDARNADNAGLGDWQENQLKLPDGIGALTQAAGREGVRFGLWIEPEMVNPSSELYRRHKDWVIHLPNREEYYYRKQLVLDLSNPQVQDYVFGVVDGLMTAYPQIAYFKWDCNSMITNVYSPYLARVKALQSHLYIEHVRGLYRILERVRAKYPELPMMLCSGGGGRTDYEALKYFTEFWPSDNTDPVERLFIQWGYSYLFPAKAMAAHVTSWGSQSLKFRTDVAMMCKLGFDIRVDEFTPDELLFARQAVRDFNRLKGTILNGNLYRLVSPYEGSREHMAVMYVDDNPLKDKAVVYGYTMHPRYGERVRNVRLQGLDPETVYTVNEINRMPGGAGFSLDGHSYTGDYLMKIGLPILSGTKLSSVVLELNVLR